MDFTSFLDTLPGGYTATYAWDFGDNSGTSTDANPSYTYASPGNYDVCLDITLSEGGGPPVCSGDEFVYPADPSGTGTWRNYMIHIKQFPSQTNPLTSQPTNIVINCPEAPFAFVLGQFIEDNLGALTVQEVVNAVVNWVNVLQGSPDFVATDAGNGYVLIQVDSVNYAGYDYCNCVSGTTAEGINLFYNWNAPVSTIDFQDSNELSFADNWACTNNAAGDTICLGEEVPGPGGNSCVISICNNVNVPCASSNRSLPFTPGCATNTFVLDGNTNTFVYSACNYEGVTADEINLRKDTVNLDYPFKMQMDLPCCDDPNGLTLSIVSVQYGPGAILNDFSGLGYYEIIPTGSAGTIQIQSADFGVANVQIINGVTYVSPTWLSQTITIIRDANELELTESLLIKFRLSGACLDEPQDFDFAISDNCGDLDNSLIWAASAGSAFQAELCGDELYVVEPETVYPSVIQSSGNNVIFKDDLLAGTNAVLKVYNRHLNCCLDTLTTGAANINLAIKNTVGGVTASINQLNATDFEVIFGGFASGKITIIAADFAALLEDPTTLSQVCNGDLSYISQNITVIGDPLLDMGSVLSGVEIEFSIVTPCVKQGSLIGVLGIVG